MLKKSVLTYSLADMLSIRRNSGTPLLGLVEDIRRRVDDIFKTGFMQQVTRWWRDLQSSSEIRVKWEGKSHVIEPAGSD